MQTKLLTTVFAAMLAVTATADNLQENFKNPGFEARPRVWWHWMNGNITKDGIRKDLMWMHNSGIGGVHNFDAGLSTPQIVPKRLEYMTPEWKDAYRLAVSLADSLGMEFTIASAPGWSATGGPWVKPQNGMKKLAWRETQVSGNKQKKMQRIQLPELSNVTGLFGDYNLPDAQAQLAVLMGGDGKQKEKPKYAEQIAVLAVRHAPADKTMAQLGAKITTSGGEGITLAALTDGSLANSCKLNATEDGSMAWIQYEFPQPQTMKAVTLLTGISQSQWTRDAAGVMSQLWVSDNGKDFRVVCDIPTGFCPQSTIDIPVTTAKYWRIFVENPKPDMTYAAYGGVIPAAKFTNIPEFRLWPVTRVNHAEEKAGFAAPWWLSQYPTPQTTANDVVKLADVIDVTDKVDAKGVLNWQVPAGDWTIYRIGWSLTGKENHPASPEATGLEVDKMDPVAFSEYLHTYLNMYKEAAGGMMGQHGIQYILTDSYEAEQETWMPTMMQEFQKRRGYALLPWMPALTGVIINSSDETERFLNDWRQTISELIAENYDRITEIVKKDYGMKGRYSESHENGRVFITDGMDVKRTAAVPMSALWCAGRTSAGSSIYMAESDIRESASVAHIYGQNLAAAESMTCMGADGVSAYTHYPGNLKQYVDKEFASGLNRVVVHTSPHQPVDDKRPGTGLMVFGQWFTRHETWAPQAKAWTDYIARTSYMLQQGHYVADVLWYYGEDSNVCALYGDKGTAPVPAGYAYDFCSPHALINEINVDGTKMSTESGMKYRVLALDPNVKYMSLPVLRKLAKLADAGVTICGARPEKNNSLSGDQAEWDNLVAKIWYSGKSNVTTGKALIDVLEGAKILPDMTYAKNDALKLEYVHRTADGKDIYWVKNPTKEAFSVDVTFRTQGRKPEIWHPETGESEPASYQMTADGRTVVTLPMVSEDALFVVFKDKTDERSVALAPKEEHVMQTITTPWHVTFQEGQGAPAEATFNTLQSYTENSDNGIKYFSGAATYTNTITLSKKQLNNQTTKQPNNQYILDMGKVCDLCEVIVNGQNLGTCWKAPYRCDVTSALHAGKNTIELRVVNVWRNRLIGDAQPDCKQKIGYTSFPYFVNAKSPLLDAGLMGPVRLITNY